MKLSFSALLWAATISTAVATTPGPSTVECLAVKQVGAYAKLGNPESEAALEVLRRVAEGRMADAAPDLEVRMGMQNGWLRGPGFKAERARACALRVIADSDLPEALSYLQNLKTSDLEPDPSFQVQRAAEIALWQAQVNRVANEPGKVLMLEQITTEPGSAASSWAVEELCDMGSARSLEFIRETIQRHLHDPRDVDHSLRFCEARIAAVTRDLDRTNALGSVLSVSNGAGEDELIGWAINQLADMHTTRADAELERYASEIDNLPDGSTLKKALWGHRIHIRQGPPPGRK